MRLRKTLLALLVMSSMLILLSGCSEVSGIYGEHDFRGFDWGNPLYLIEKEEYAMNIYDGDSRLMYWDTFLGYDANITYIFYENNLTHGYVQIESDKELDDVFDGVVSTLSNSYGAPTKSTDSSEEFTTSNGGFIYVSKSGLDCTVLFGKQ